MALRALRMLCIPFMSVFFCATISKGDAVDNQNDPFLWLEDIYSQSSLDWVEERNRDSLQQFQQDPRYQSLYNDIFDIISDSDRLPSVTLRGESVYNLWQDSNHSQGLWRRQSIAAFRGQDSQWQTLLDLDELSRQENVSWVFKGATCQLSSDPRCMLHLSDGGKDAVTLREFNLDTQEFVNGGFSVPEAKSNLTWIDSDTLIIGSDFGPGSMTDSGYARTLRLWQRGTPLQNAPEIFAGQPQDTWVYAEVYQHGKQRWIILNQGLGFFSHNRFLYQAGQAEPLPLPRTAAVQGVFADHLLFSLRDDWGSYPAGSLLSLDLTAWVDSPAATQPDVIFTPSAGSILSEVHLMASAMVVATLDDVSSVIHIYPQAPSGSAQLFGTPQVLNLPQGGNAQVRTSSIRSDHLILSYEDLLTPATMYYTDAQQTQLETLRSLAPQFDSSDLVVSQHFVSSADGTQVPYFLVNSRNAPLNGNTPTLLYAYGGFEISILPNYIGSLGKAWLERGGAYVIANIRGGGEYGPEWHQAALKLNRHKAYEDFFAVSRHLIDSGVTSPRHLGIYGGSNGGLLMGVALTQQPQLYNAIVCAVPLLDMMRYHLLLAGASWMAEYGDPSDPVERPYLRSYSPYQNTDANASYPPMLIMTSTRDDRVHPGHARKMAALLSQQGHNNWYYENTEGGHAGSANLEQAARMMTLRYIYLYQQLFQTP